MFQIRFAESVEEDLRRIQIYYRNQILDPMEEQLAREPETATRNRKLLENVTPPCQSVAPIWELRVGEYRVFYDVSPAESVVHVRAVRKKPRGANTEDIVETVNARDLQKRIDAALQTSSMFWKLIEDRRKESTLSMKELRSRLKKRKK